MPPPAENRRADAEVQERMKQYAEMKKQQAEERRRQQQRDAAVEARRRASGTNQR
jgi:hypothetical protein